MLKKLQEGDRIGLVAPASPFPKDTFEKGVARISDRGFQIIKSTSLEDQNGYLAGTDAARAQSVMDFFTDDRIRAIFCARGGYGTLRILDQLDYEVIRQHPKILCGYSDITALLLAIWEKTKRITFHGPMVTSFAEMPGQGSEKIWTFWDTGTFSIEGDAWQIVREGRATGPLLGGNLAVLCSLLGTSYFPDMTGAILFLEDSGESLYRIDRLLTQLRLAGVTHAISALLLGTFSKGPSIENVVALAKDIFSDTSIPIISGFPVGHEGENLVMPIGAMVTIDTELKKIWSDEVLFS